MALTPKQETFCLAYLETGNATKAYRTAYSADAMLEATINVKACNMLKTDKIRARLEELRKPIMQRHAVTVDSLLAELEEARALAFETGKAAAAVTATMGKAKLMGLDKQIVEHQVSATSLGVLMDELSADA